jgi:predicted esterase
MSRKPQLLLIALAVSVVFNFVGIFFFVWFLQTSAHLRSVKRERNILAQSTALIRGQNKVNQILNSDQVVQSKFVSHADGQEDVFVVVPPRAPKPEKGFDLVIYLHGMGSTFLEPFVSPSSQPIAQRISDTRPTIVFASLNYGRAYSWGNDSAISDVSQNIRELVQRYPINRIVIMGTSMGGCTALSYTTLAPDDLKSKIIGAVSSEGAGDLAQLFSESKAKSIPNAMTNAFGGTPQTNPQQYLKHSFLQNLDRLDRNVRFAILSATRDEIVPTSFQKKIVSTLESRNFPTKLLEVDDGHNTPPADLYLEGLDFVLNNNGR